MDIRLANKIFVSKELFSSDFTICAPIFRKIDPFSRYAEIPLGKKPFVKLSSTLFFHHLFQPLESGNRTGRKLQPSRSHSPCNGIPDRRTEQKMDSVPFSDMCRM